MTKFPTTLTLCFLALFLGACGTSEEPTEHDDGDEHHGTEGDADSTADAMKFVMPSSGKVFFIGNAMVDLFLQSRNWPFGSAIAVTLVVIMLITVSFYMRMTLRKNVGRDESLM